MEGLEMLRGDSALSALYGGYDVDLLTIAIARIDPDTTMYDICFMR